MDSFAETKRMTKSISAEMRGQEAISAPQRILLVVCTVRRFIHNRHSRIAWPRLSDRQQRWVYSLPSRNRHTTMTLVRLAETVNVPAEDIAASAGSDCAAQLVEQHLGERTTATTAARASNPNPSLASDCYTLCRVCHRDAWRVRLQSNRTRVSAFK